MSAMRFERHIEVKQSAVRADTILAEASDLSKQHIKQVMQKGAVWLTTGKSTRRLRRASKPLKQGDTLHLYYDEAVLSAQVRPAQLLVDEGDYSVWYKPYGMLSQGSKWGDHCTINRWAETQLIPQRSSYIVHRLDRAASGLILLAHAKRVAALLAAAFAERTIQKKYQAIVHGQFKHIKEPLIMDTEIAGQAALSKARLLKFDADKQCSLLDIEITTGRKHQIRQHLMQAGFPIVGDRMYGRNGASENAVDAVGENLQLTAYALQLQCPLSNAVKSYTLPENLLLSL